MSKDKKELKTQIVIGDFRGSPTIAIYELNDEGKTKEHAIITFGKKKAQAIIKHIKEIEEFSNK